MKITTINSIETSSLCDNKCEYCPAPLQHKHRPVGSMTWDTFEIAIDWVLHLCRKGTQRELNLFGVGEPLLNINIVSFVEYARKKLPFRQKIHLNTNGNLMNEQVAMALKRAGISQIDITAHKPRSAAKTIRIFQKVGIPFVVSLDFVTRPNDWAGQVDWFKPDYYKTQGMECPWLGRGQVMVMSNGDITPCCIDAFGTGIFANIHRIEDFEKLDVAAFRLCETCHHIVPNQNKILQFAGG
jgi:MoaA/NifB/PqqE/SkfB family radical SAM enzyme